MKINKTTIFSLGNILLFSLFSLIIAFKGNTRDTQLYLYLFKYIDWFEFNPLNFYLQTGMEVGFGVLVYFIRFFTKNFSLFSFIISALTFYFIKLSADLLKIRFIDVLFFYIPTLFITQQLMQIRQGLASAIVIYGILLYYVKSKLYKGILWDLLAFSIHSSSIFYFPFFNKYIKNNFLNNKYPVTKLICWFIFIFILCRITMDFSILQSISSRVANYEHSEFGAAKGFFQLANIRALFIFILFLFGLRSSHPNYLVLLFMFTTSLGIRLGFYDFGILSGRVGVLLGFSEIFLFVMCLRTLVPSYFYILALIYLLIHGFITLEFQVPYMIKDYFSYLAI